MSATDQSLSKVLAAPNLDRSAPLLIDNRLTRRWLLDRYALLNSPRGCFGKEQLSAVIDRLGYVQIDSICMVERAHHMILAARADRYKPTQLQELAEIDRQVFENWTHDAAFLPVQFYPYWQRRFDLCRESLMQRWQRWGRQGFDDRLEQVLDHVRVNGPVKSRELAPKRERGSPGWWDWHPDKSALEFLWRTGKLAVTRREGFQKLYDLSERVVPENHLEQRVSSDEMIEWACASALERLGFGTAGEIAGFWASIDAAAVKAWIERQPKGRLQKVSIAPATGSRTKQAWALADRLEDQLALVRERRATSRLRVLSPFDPLIRDRKRLAHVFGYDYRIEVFVPKEKRQYGYYVFPLLEGERLVGRIDMQHRRDRSELLVENVWWESGIAPGIERRRRLLAELDRLRKFVGAERLTFGKLCRELSIGGGN